jgi:uncharacterized protein (DUF885 family)
MSNAGRNFSPDSKGLHRFLEDEWERTLREQPLFASELGDSRYNDRWPDLSPHGFQQRYDADKSALQRLDEFSDADLNDVDRLNVTLYRGKCEDAVGEYEIAWRRLPLTAREGIQDANAISESLQFAAVLDYEQWISRLEAFPTYMKQTIDLMREGIQTRMVHSKVVMQRVPQQIRAQIVDDAKSSLFYKPFLEFSAQIDVADRERLSDKAVTAISQQIVPAYQELLRFFEDEYLPACFDDVGVWQMSNGREIYEFFARQQTTTGYSADEIHEIGLKEVKRIRQEMEAVIRQTGFAGDFSEFLTFLRSDPQFYFDDADDLLKAYQACCQKVDAALPRLFDQLPKVGYDIRSIPMNIAPDTTAAYYRPLSADGLRPGSYFVNLYRPEVRPKYEIEALSLHEAVPGHHLQIALAMELDGLPAFRRFAPEGQYTGYVEGWALYAESLGGDLDCYQDPYSRFGQLTYEMWRAVRLVVDTGMHVFNWSRQEAIDYFSENAAKTQHDIENEIDRYIAWPGQAVAYKIGEIEFQSLRRQAEQGRPEFDIRAFHHLLLKHGPVPLNVLREIVQSWIADGAES